MKYFLGTLLLTFATACSTSEIGTSDLKDTEHYGANHCELFIDKVINISGSHAYKNVHFYLKTLNHRLDGKILRVGVRYRAIDVTDECQRNPGNGSCAGLGQWQERVATNFFSNDYYKLNLFIGSDYNPTLRYQAVFFVKTTAGTTYWAKQNQNDFTIDYPLYTELGNAYYRTGRSAASYGEYDLSYLPKTADFFTKLNPNGCR